MPKRGPSSAFLFVGGYDLSPYTYGITEGYENLMEQTNGLGVSWEEQTPIGIGRATLETEGGLYESETDANNAAFVGNTGTLQLAATGPNRNPGGAVTLLNGTYGGQYVRTAARDALTKANAVHTISGEWKLGLALHYGAESGDGDNENLDTSYLYLQQPAGTTGGVADLHVSDLTLGGYTSVAIKVRDSSDGVAWSDLATFSVVTVQHNNQRITFSGTVNRYMAVDWAWNGSGSGESISFFCGVHVTDPALP